MKKVLFIPLNTNHVLIFEPVINRLSCESVVLCHDRISNDQRYHTEQTLRDRNIPYIHFSGKINRDLQENFFSSLLHFFRMQKAIDDLLKQISPDTLVLAIDNDPIAQIFIRLSKRYKIRSILIQEGLIRPYEYTRRKTYTSDYLYRLLNRWGIFLRYTKYGTTGCDIICASGNRAANIFQNRGVSEKHLTIVGQPKYDHYLERVKNFQSTHYDKKKLLFAAGSSIVRDELNIQFLKVLVDSAKNFNAFLIIKMHPRTKETPQDIYNIIGVQDKSCLEVVKQSDDTFEILKDVYGLITVSSTMIIEALLLDKEGITVDYLAGEQRLDYGKYDAVYTIEDQQKISDVIAEALQTKKSPANKKHLLEDELFKLDGNASERVAHLIQSSL